MTWSYKTTLLDTAVAPGIRGFSAAKIPDLTELFPQAEHWLANHFLNTILRGKFKEGMRQVPVTSTVGRLRLPLQRVCCFPFRFSIASARLPTTFEMEPGL